MSDKKKKREEENEEALSSVNIVDVPAEQKEKYTDIGYLMSKVLEDQNHIKIPNAMVAMTVLDQGLRSLIDYIVQNRSKAKSNAAKKFVVTIGDIDFGISYREDENEEKEGNFTMFANITVENKINGKSDDETESE